MGTLVYSPFTGLFFLCIEDLEARDELEQWLDSGSSNPPNEQYLRSLGPGWAVHTDRARFPRQHLLSSSGRKPYIYKPDSLLVVNWLITSSCSCDCRYCYSQDIMTEGTPSQGPSGIRATAKQILSYSPLAVVLTGGDPLSEDGIETAMDALHGRTGIVVDTNGIGVTRKHVELFKKYDVFVRVSLDSERPRVNNSLRPIKTGACSLEAALKCINICLENEIGVGVQTVVTKTNMSDMESLGHKLYRLGITSWRLQLLANHSRFDDYVKLRPKADRFKNTIVPTIGQKNRTGWDERMSIQVIDNTTPNAVVLVHPDGRFLTEVDGKVPLNKNNQRKPSMAQIRRGPLDLEAHTDRYLGIAAGKSYE